MRSWGNLILGKKWKTLRDSNPVKLHNDHGKIIKENI